MKKARAPLLGGLSVQLMAVTVLPLTLLLLTIAFGSVFLHQQDMRSLVGERDERAVRSAAAALDSELHHRSSSINSLVSLLEASGQNAPPVMNDDLASDFDGGIAYLAPSGRVISFTPGFDSVILEKKPVLASASNPGPVFSQPLFTDEKRDSYVLISQYATQQNLIVAGAFSPANLVQDVLPASLPAAEHLSVYLIDGAGNVLYWGENAMQPLLPGEFPGLRDALSGQTGTTYVEREGQEHIVAYSPVSLAGWAVITEEQWEAMVSPSLRLTQMAPLVIVPAFVLALLALIFVARRIIQPLQHLETKAAALAWGDFDAIEDPVGGIAEIEHLQRGLREMSHKVRAAQEGLRDYIGAITSAQEEERLRLARELHDETIQSVIALKQRVQLTQRSIKDPASRRTLKELESLSEQTIEGLRRMTRALRPIYLEDLGLVTALEMLARETAQSHDISVEFKFRGREQRLSYEVELALYRIAQEAINNVVRHARATRAEIDLEFAQEETILEVRDDGMGFQMPKSPTDFAPKGHFGLLGIRERAELIGARLEVDSSPQQGTRLAIKL